MENNTTNPQQKISTPMAIIVAGALIMIGILVSKGAVSAPNAPKTLSEQVGVSKDSLNACIKSIDLDALDKNINDSVEKAMSKVEQRGTPYTVVIGPNGFMTDIKGAENYTNVKAVVAAATEGKLAPRPGVENKTLTEIYKGDLPPVVADEHIYGNKNAAITLVEYSDFECPYCKQFHPTLKKIVDESNGTIRWIYRDYPLHQHSFEKLVAAECVSKIKGNDAYWEYGDLLFSLLKTANDSVSEQL